MLAVKRFKGTESLCSTLLGEQEVRQVHKPAGLHSTASLDREHAWSQLIPEGKDGSCDRGGNALEKQASAGNSMVCNSRCTNSVSAHRSLCSPGKVSCKASTASQKPLLSNTNVNYYCLQGASGVTDSID